METVDLVLKRRNEPGMRGYLYDVLLNGELIASSRDPEFAACRWLHGHGYSGQAAFWREGKNEPDIVIKSIERAAGLAVYEDQRRGLRLTGYHPRPDMQEMCGGADFLPVAA